MWAAIDDTDGPSSGCTTAVLTEIVADAQRAGFDLLGLPRLVRLNPNVPWKTRGNAALAARFGHGLGRRRRVGELEDGPVWSYADGAELGASEQRRLRALAWRAILRGSPNDRGTDPALVTSPSTLPPALYHAAVSTIVPLPEARRVLDRAGARQRVRGARRGLVGAASALAWPGDRRSFELIAYRDPARIGSRREVDAASVREVESADPRLALNFDPRTRRLLVAPHSDCPILFGLRSRSRAALLRALPAIRSEPVRRWLLFETNQGSGDHLVRRRLPEFPRLSAGRSVGWVREPPTVGRGGHATVLVGGRTGAAVRCIAFEPTKTLPRIVASLRPGDRVEVAGGRSRDGSVHLERLRILSLVDRWGPAVVPACPSCGRRPRSLGTGRGYRCRGCRRRFPPEHAARRRVDAEFEPGTYHPTLSARRHLHPWT